MKRDFDQLCRQLLAPEQPQLEKARAIVEGVSDPQVAWQRLGEAGVIPLDWTTDPPRSFFAIPCRTCPLDEHGDMAHLGCPSCKAAHFEFSYPRNLQACLAIAANPPGVARAESIAKEAIVRLRAWGASVGDALKWQVESPELVRSSGFKAPALGIAQANPRAWFASQQQLEELTHEQETALAAQLGNGSTLFADVVSCLRGERVYDDLARRAVVPYSERPNPFSPLLDILAQGYVPRRFDEEGFALVAERVPQ